MNNISSIFVAALLSGACGLVAQNEAIPNELFGPVKLSLTNGVNSPDLDFSPTYFNNGIIFTSDRARIDQRSGIRLGKKKNYTDLFFSELNGEVSFKSPQRLDQLNSKYHDGIASFSNTSNQLYFTRNNKKGTILNTKKAKRLKIYSATFVEGEWTEPQAVSFNVEKYSTCHPAISADGQTMYFASNRPGGYGEMDIYVSYLEDAKWSEPMNMGQDINTDKNEIFPFVDANDLLFFSSEGHQNMGGLDMFMAQEVVDPHMTGDNNWEITNLGEPFNSFADDFGFVGAADGERGFLTSSRSGGFGKDDIYAWEIVPEVEEEPVMAIKSPIAPITKEKQIRIIDANTGKELPFTDVVLSEANRPGNIVRHTTSEDGSLRFEWNDQSNYFISTEKEGYVAHSKVYKQGEMDGDVLVIEVDPMTVANTSKPRINQKPGKVVAAILTEDNPAAHEEDIEHFFDREEEPESAKLEDGQLIELEHIYYEFDKYQLKESAKVELDKVVNLLKMYPEMEIDLNSHTDSRGADAYNSWLSQERAKSAVDYIVSKGIEKSRLTAKGYGEAAPVNECTNTMRCSEDKHEMNRRTEFVIKNLGEKKVLRSNKSKQKKMTSVDHGGTPGPLPVVQSIFYPSSQTVLSSSDKEALNKLVGVMKKHDGMTLRVASYTDAIGGEDNNLILSEKRAQQVVNYMTSQGIRAQRLDYVGYGESFPANGCQDGINCTPAEHDQNRRTDVLVSNPGGANLAVLNAE